MSHALSELATDSLEDKLGALDREDEISRVLAEIKTRRGIA
jgi:hypothetical protein